MGLLLFFDRASGFYSLGIVLGFRMGGAWFIASVGLVCSFGLNLREWGGWILPLRGLRLLGFRGWSTGGHCLQGHGDSWGVFVSCRLEKKRQNRVTFPGFLGWLGFFIPLGLALGGTFVLWIWGWGFIQSWLWDGAWMVEIWGGVWEQWRLGDLVNGVKTYFFNAYYNFFLFYFFCRYLRF